MRLNEPRAPRPWVAFPAGDETIARRLYRAQHLIWIWIGLFSLLAGLAFFLRIPHLFDPNVAPTLVVPHSPLDDIREALFGSGILIALGVWLLRRYVEIAGHLAFFAGSLMTAAAAHDRLALPSILWLGVALASAFRVYFLIAWIGATRVRSG